MYISINIPKYLLGTVDIISSKKHAEMKRMLRNMVIMQSHTYYILDLFHNHAYHITSQNEYAYVCVFHASIYTYICN